MKLFKKRKKTIIFAGTAVCIAVVGFLVIPRIVSAGSGDITVSATPVRMGDLTNYISVTGTVCVYIQLGVTVFQRNRPGAISRQPAHVNSGAGGNSRRVNNAGEETVFHRNISVIGNISGKPANTNS